MAENLGTTRADIEGRNLRDLMSEAEFEANQRLVMAFLESGRQSSTSSPEQRFLATDSERLVQVHRTRFEDPRHNQTTLISFSHDITEAVEGRRSMLRSRLLEDMQSLYGAGYHIVNTGTGRHEYSDRLLGLLGYGGGEIDAAQADGQDLDIYPPDDRCLAEEICARAFAVDKVAVYALRTRHREGHLIPVQVRSKRVKIEESGEVHIISAVEPLGKEALDELPVEGIVEQPNGAA